MYVCFSTDFAGAIPQYNARFGFGSGPIVMSGLLCGGSESSLTECTSSIPSSYCDHFYDAGVTCQGLDVNTQLQYAPTYDM